MSGSNFVNNTRKTQ